MGMLASTMFVTVAKNSDVVQLPAVLDKDQKIPKRPAGIARVGRGVSEADQAVGRRNVVEEACFVGGQGAYDPVEIQRTSAWTRRCALPICDISRVCTADSGLGLMLSFAGARLVGDTLC